MATSYEEKKRANRLNQAKFRASEKGKEYMAKWRAENREHYLEYQKNYQKKKKELKNAEN